MEIVRLDFNKNKGQVYAVCNKHTLNAKTQADWKKEWKNMPQRH
jgi:hypothetical protein